MSGARRALSLAGLVLAGCFDLGTEPWDPAVLEEAGDGVDTSTVTTGGGDHPDPDHPDGPPPIECPHADGLAAEVIVKMVENTFRPAIVRICPGDTITWQNLDTKEHTIFTGTPEAPDALIASHKIYYGQSYSQVFATSGRYVYYCSVHKKKMRDAEVIVQ